MPELPEVENVKLSLINNLIGKKIVNCKIKQNNKVIKYSNIEDFRLDIINQEIRNLTRKGKYLILTLDTGWELIVHLGMTGLLTYVNNLKDIPTKYIKHLQIVLKLNDNNYLCYCDIRRFGSLRLLNQIESYKPISLLGPEVWEKDSLKIFKNNLSKKKWINKNIKEAIMDQNVIAGVGNIYASEALYKSNINPNRLINDLSEVEIELLLNNIRIIFEKSIELGGCSISDYMNGQGKIGQYQNHLKAYNQKVCPKGHEIIEQKIKGRNTFYCNKCQI